ncbi:MAG: hypothetical protein IJP56_10145, partial [Synergistaceae bacterium]|nr:hypothetical protein [Synergistaceae bacterium]
KTNTTLFNAEAIKIPYTKEYINSHFRDIDEQGRQCRKRFDAGKWRTYYPDNGMIPNDVWDIPYENSMSKNRVDYPTQKPEKLLERIILASSNPGNLVMDCFMGSGTTQAVAMKLGRRFIGADINLGAVHTATKRLLNIAADIKAEDKNENEQSLNKYTGFEVYNVNNYEFFRNPAQARSLLIDALGIQEFPEGSSIWDGELDGRMVKIMPVNRIAAKADLKDLIDNLPYKKYESISAEDPSEIVERITIVCMGHEPDLKAHLQYELIKYKVDIEILDILKDRKDLQLKRESEAEVVRDGNKLVIKNFYPLNLMNKLSCEKEYLDDWRTLTDSVLIDWYYDGAVMQPIVTDIPGKNELVKGVYDIPDDAGTIRIKITDLLSESLELEVK